jgi:methyl-accepting chemotaxis protein
MDQVTQQNAASAQESSAASEELAGQAENFKDMVLGLQHIISGESAASRQLTENQPLEGHIQHHGESRIKLAKAVEHNGTKSIIEAKGPKVLKPEEVIPFDDK